MIPSKLNIIIVRYVVGSCEAHAIDWYYAWYNNLYGIWHYGVLTVGIGY